MSPEIFWLTLTALMTAIFWLPYIINRLVEMGVKEAVFNADADTTPQAPWAKRMMKAHRNAIENLVVFAPLAIAVHLTESASVATGAAAAVFFWARLAHFVVFTLSVPVLRTVAFAVGFFCQVILGLSVLDVL